MSAYPVSWNLAFMKHGKPAAYRKLISVLFLFTSICLLPQYSFAFTSNELVPIKQVAAIGGKEGKARLRQPSSVLVGKDGKIFVLDGSVNRVAVFSSGGKFLFDFGADYLNMPLGMAMDNKGRLYVADTKNSRIQLFSSQGKHLKQIDLPKSEKGLPTEPVDVAIDDKKNILYIVDNHNHRLLIYDLKKNSVVKIVGKMGMADGEFRWPFSLAINSKGVVYLVDVVNTTVRTIHPAENWAFGYDIGGWGIQKGEFYRPKGVAVDSKGRVFVSDSYLGVVQLFDQKGRFLAVLTDANKKIHRFTTPARLFIDKQDRLYAVEMFANRVTIFEIGR